MSVIRVKKDKNYTVMSNFHLRDMRLSNKTIGLMCKMLSLPEDWDYTVNGLAAICKDGKDSIRAQLKELETYGYLTRERVRNDKGQVAETIYTLTEKPMTGNPSQENQTVYNERIGANDTFRSENPMTEKPTQGKPTQLSKEVPSKENKRLLNKEVLSIAEGYSDAFKESWAGFVEMRKSMKKPMTLRAAKMILKKLSTYSGGNEEIQIAILDKSIIKCWTDVYEPKEQQNKEKTNGNIQRNYRESQPKSQGNADAEWDEQLRNWCARQKSEPRPWDV